MKYSITATILALATPIAVAQESSREGSFQIATFNITGQTIPEQGVVSCDTIPVITLNNGKLLDQQGRTGEVVANSQFQFDEPVQGPIVDGFGIYSNGSLALNGNAIWWSCNSGSFANLYSQSIAVYCVPVYIVTYPCSGGSISASSATGSTSSSSLATLITTTSTSSLSSSASSAPSTPISTESVATTSAYVPVPVVPSPSAAPPYPAGNATVPAGTASGSGVASGSTTTTGAPSSTTSPVAAVPGAASNVAIGGKLFAVLAGLVAYAMV